MFEFVAIGQQTGQRWKKPLTEGRVVCLGRAPQDGWDVPWDLRISREHCELELRGERLHVRCLETALNPAYRLGEAVTEFSIGPGEDFRIGQTTFRVDRVPVQAAAEQPGDRTSTDGFRGQLARLRQRLGAAPSAADPEVERLQQELAALRAELDALKARPTGAAPAEAGDKRDTVKETDVEALDDLQSELEAMQNQLDSQSSARIDKPVTPAGEQPKPPPPAAKKEPKPKAAAKEKPQPDDPKLAALKAQLATKKKAPAKSQPAKAKEAAAKKEAVKPPAASAKAADAADAEPAADPKRFIWSQLTEAVRQTIRRIAAGETADENAKTAIIGALNQLIKEREFLGADEIAPILERPELAETVAALPKGIKGIKKDWSQVAVRAAGRLVLQTVYSGVLRRRKPLTGPVQTLAYMSRGDIFGEIGVLLKQLRSATCVAFDHPPDEKGRKPSRVELVRIGADVFEQMVTRSAVFAERVNQLIKNRQQHSVRVAERSPWDADSTAAMSPEFERLGLVQGQSLLLVDLDRCTRCGDCIRACVNTHDDGYSRLFLDGPRFEKYLVPSACRKCLDPACMIGCPVGSIQRGPGGEILIRDWCIGCGLCAKQCPYDSIQMHDLGIVPQRSPEWRFMPASAVAGDAWTRPHFADGRWLRGVSPMSWDIEMQSTLTVRCPDAAGATLQQALCFRHEFQVAGEWLRARRKFRLLASSQGSRVEFWINGRAVAIPQDDKQQKRGEWESDFAATELQRGRNLLAVRAHPPFKAGNTILSLRLDVEPELEEGAHAKPTEVKLVTDRAVVCDLCSSLPSKQPACVEQCPHDAALRVNALFEFPRQ